MGALHPITWITAFGAMACLLIGIGFAKAHRVATGLGFVLFAIVLGLISAVSSAMVAGGHLTP